MSQNNCECDASLVDLPIKGLKMVVDANGLNCSGSGGMVTWRKNRKVTQNAWKISVGVRPVRSRAHAYGSHEVPL